MKRVWLASLFLTACHGTSDAVSDSPVRSCPAAYNKTVSDSSSSYRVELSPVSWEVAAADCADDGATTHLVVFGNDEERDSVFTSIANGIQVWVGFTDRRVDGSYQWITAEEAPNAPITWAPNEPDEIESVYDCARLLPNGAQYPGSFEMRNCVTSGARYVCECDDFADDPTRY